MDTREDRKPITLADILRVLALVISLVYGTAPLREEVRNMKVGVQTLNSTLHEAAAAVRRGSPQVYDLK